MGFNEQKNIGGLAVFLLVGLVVLGLGVYFIYSDYAALKSWKPMKGEVVFSSVDSYYDYEYDATDYYVDISYKYLVKGNWYEGTCCDYLYSDEQEVKKFIAIHQVGTGIDILVDPNKPDVSRVKTDIHPFNEFNLIFAVVGGIFTIIGSTIMYYIMFNKQ